MATTIKGAVGETLVLVDYGDGEPNLEIIDHGHCANALLDDEGITKLIAALEAARRK